MLSVRRLEAAGVCAPDLTVADGACVAVMGPSGAGKTRLLRAIADLDPSRGEVMADGVRREEVPAPAWRRIVAYVPAESAWWAERVGAHFKGSGATRALLQAVGLGSDALSWPVARLSTGERQRLALARALVLEPRVLLLDEPTAALDGTARAAVEELLRQRLAAGVSILLVTHDPDQAARLRARTVRIGQGRLVEPGG